MGLRVEYDIVEVGLVFSSYGTYVGNLAVM